MEGHGVVIRPVPEGEDGYKMSGLQDQKTGIYLRVRAWNQSDSIFKENEEGVKALVLSKRDQRLLSIMSRGFSNLLLSNQ